jgi:hypothetical protein
VGYKKFISSPTADRGFAQQHFIHQPLQPSFSNIAFFATRRTIICYFQFWMMDKTLFVMSED